MTVLINHCDVNILDEETRAYINNLSINLWRSYPEETFDSFVANLLQGQLQINEQHKILLLGVIENIVDNQSMPLIKKNFNNIIQYTRSFSMHFKLNINNFYLLIELYYLYASNNIKAILKEISNLSDNIKVSAQNFFLSQPNNLRQKLFDKEIPEQKLIFELCKSSYFKAVHPEKFDIKRRTINLWHENKLNALTMTKHLISFNDKSHQICNCFIETVISQCNNECLFKLFENNMEYLCSYINYIPFSIIVQLISDNDLIKDKVGLYLASCKDETNKFSIEIEQLLIILSEIFNKDKHVLQLEEQLIIIDKIKAVTKEKDFIDEKVFEYISNKDLYFFMIKQPTKRLIRQYIDYIDIESIDITNENAEKYLNIFEKCIHTIKEMKSDKTNAMMRILLISGFTLQVHDAYKYLEFSFQYNYDFLYKDDTELFLWQRKMKANEWAIFKERLVNNKENEVIKFSTDKRSLFLLFKLLIEYTKHKQWPRASFLRTITDKATFEEVYRKCKNFCNKYPNEYHFLLGLKDRIIKNTIEYLPFQKDIVLRY
ncbi:MAG: hypothetical protein OMM_02679 [Candidatus Magnetoglobus multicellularis str. Araruama]|uniref:Uncharacterized protein n=1 Tax=Candidatus Magnetoglobus multicellularis str. Araruama TaxID=890399 RepID=A0A1V1P8Q1_9BACT|nr:MAG: hypothetical protein OMM_02679 [Candidatus Magnetoglobus multicellularis str. Araruama]